MRICLGILTGIISRSLTVLLILSLGIAATGISVPEAAASSGPDLIVQEIVLSPEDPAIGDNVAIKVTVKNQGTGDAEFSNIACYIDDILIDTENFGALAAGTLTTVTINWVAEAGSHTIMAVVDPSGHITETDETNNSKTFNFSTLAADLSIQSVSWLPEEPSRGDSVEFTITVINQGSCQSKSTKVNLYIDGTSRGYQDVYSLAVGGTVTRTYKWVALSGQHTIKTTIDEVEHVNESDETNNEYSCTFSTIPPDLIVEGITWEPENPSKNDTVTFTAAVKNQGSGDADTSHLAYYIDGEYQSSIMVDPLEAGGSANITFEWKASSEGHEIKVIIDSYKKVIESDEINNENTVSLLTLTPDLIIEDISWEPADAAVGDTVTFTVTISNQGSGTSGATRTSLYVDGKFMGYLDTPAIAADGEVTKTLQWVATGGSHPVSAMADYQDLLNEADENNNWMNTTIPIIPPDLLISNINWLPENPSIGDTVTFTVTIENQGGGKAANFRVAYYMDDEILDSNYVNQIASETSANQTCEWQSQTGLHTFKVVVDSNNQVSEGDEDNNENTVTISPNMPDLFIEAVTWSPLDLRTGDEATFNIQIKNQGTVRADSSRLTYYIDGSLIGYNDVKQVYADDSVTVKFPWVATAGPHIIELIADSNNQITEINENNNKKTVNLPPPDLLIQGITWIPENPSIGDTVSFTATLKNQGSGKTQKAHVAFYIDGASIGSIDLPEINPGDTISRSCDWIAERGSHTIKAAADVDNTVTESDETNNEAETDFSIMTPDLVIEDISWFMESPLKNDEVTLVVTIKNQGSYKANESQLAYSIDDDTAVYNNVEEIEAGDSVIKTFLFTVKAGPHIVQAAADADDEVEELDETNNEAALEFSTVAPDLVVKSITWAPVDAAVGDTVNITVKIENRGRSNALEPRLDLHIDGSPAGYVDIDEIDAGVTVTRDFTWTAEAGLHKIDTFIDLGELVLESNEDNNTKSTELSLIEPDAPIKLPKKLANSSPQDKGFLGSNWWLFLLIAALLGGVAFFSALRSLRKN